MRRRSSGVHFAFIVGLAVAALRLLGLPPLAAAATVAVDQFGTAGDDGVRSVSAGSSGDIWVSGSAAGTLTGTTVGGGAGRFLRRYDPSGEATLNVQGAPLSAPVYEPADPPWWWGHVPSHLRYEDIAASADGGVYESGSRFYAAPDWFPAQVGWLRSFSPTGTLVSTLDVGGQPRVLAGASAGGLFMGSVNDAYHAHTYGVRKLGPDGGSIWADTVRMLYEADPSAGITVADGTPDDGLYVGGYSNALVEGAGDPTPEGQGEAWGHWPAGTWWVRKYHADGTRAWTRQFLDDGSSAWGIAASDEGVAIGASDTLHFLEEGTGTVRWAVHPMQAWDASDQASGILGVASAPGGSPIVVGIRPEPMEGPSAFAIDAAVLDVVDGAVATVTVLARGDGVVDDTNVSAGGGLLAVGGRVAGSFDGHTTAGGSDGFLIRASGLPEPPRVFVDVSPPLPDGEGGWYVSGPSVRFRTGVPVRCGFRGDPLAPYETGGTLRPPEGDHTLDYEFDFAGGPLKKSRRFRVDLTAPVLRIGGVANGEALRRPTVLSFAAHDAHSGIASVEATLDGAPFESGGVVSRPGSHVLQVRAADVAGRSVRRTLAFRVLPRAALGVPQVIPYAPMAGRLLRVQGLLRPAHRNGAAVVLRFYRWTDPGAGELSARRQAAGAAPGALGGLSISPVVGSAGWRLSRSVRVRVAAGAMAYRVWTRLGAGQWKVVAVHEDADHARTLSGPRFVRVR